MGASRNSGIKSIAKQIGLGMMQYVQDYEETYPMRQIPSDKTTPTRPTWCPLTVRELLLPYTKNGDLGYGWGNNYTVPIPVAGGGIWTCPSQPFADVWKQGGFNRGLIAGELAENGNKVDRPVVAMAQVGTPASVALMTETGTTDGWNNCDDLNDEWWWHGGAQYPPQFTGATSSAQWDRDTTAADMGSLPNPWLYRAMPRYRHNRTANFVFADGHAKAIPKGALNWCTNINFKGMQDTWDGANGDWTATDAKTCGKYGVSL